MALDEYDKFRKKFNDKLRKITKAEVADLNDRQRKLYDEIVANENIAAVPKGNSRTKLGNRVRLREFDSETFKPVKNNPLYGTIKKTGPTREEIMSRKRAKANEYKTNVDYPGVTKGYDTRLGMSVPKPKPRVAPKERKALGGKVHRGRKANYSG